MPSIAACKSATLSGVYAYGVVKAVPEPVVLPVLPGNVLSFETKPTESESI